MINIFDDVNREQRAGERFDILWPPNYMLTVGTLRYFGSIYTKERYIMDRLLNPREFLCEIGYVHPIYRAADALFDPYVFYSSGRIVVAVNPITNNLSFVAESSLHLSFLFFKNLSYYYNVYLSPETERKWFDGIETRNNDLVRYQSNRKKILDLCKINSGKFFRVGAFIEERFTMCTEEDVYSLSGKGLLENLNKNFSIIGTIGLRNSEPNCRYPVLINKKCCIYVLIENSLYKMAPTLLYFFRIGTSEIKVKKLYNLGNAVEMIYLRGENDINDDDEQSMYAADVVRFRKRPLHLSSRGDR